MIEIGDKVKWADESEVPSTTVLTVIRVGSFTSSNKSYDLVVESPSGNQFYVQFDEICWWTIEMTDGGGLSLPPM
jgi:hypothetical protein